MTTVSQRRAVASIRDSLNVFNRLLDDRYPAEPEAQPEVEDDSLIGRLAVELKREHDRCSGTWSPWQMFRFASEVANSWQPSADIPIADEAQASIRTATSNGILLSAFTALVNATIAAGDMSVPDNTAGIVRKISAVNFLTFPVLRLEEGARLTKLTKGRQAEHASFGMREADMAIGRFAGQLRFDEQDLLSAANTDALLQAPRELGRASANLLPNLAIGLLLSNMTTEKNTPLPPAAESVDWLISQAVGYYRDSIRPTRTPLGRESDRRKFCDLIRRLLTLTDASRLDASFNPFLFGFSEGDTATARKIIAELAEGVWRE